MFKLLFAVFLSPVQEHPFKVLAFFTARNDKAHISFVNEANKWFTGQARINEFVYDTTSDWTKMNDSTLARYDVLVFLDTRPDTPAHRRAFERYMKKGGGWLGFHFAGFALTPSAYPQNWNWYHNEFIGAGEYASNTWRPTSAILKVEKRKHAITKQVQKRFRSSPNEWYRWQNDLTRNKDIQVLVSIDPSSFPLGTGPKPHEIWHSGYYPVVWTNKKYRMVYMNMGHNDIDYEGGTNRELSRTFDNETQNRLVMDALLWLGGRQH
jgi:hypothetical protein